MSVAGDNSFKGIPRKLDIWREREEYKMRMELLSNNKREKNLSRKISLQNMIG